MSSEATKRTSEEVVKEYNNLAFKAGNLQYTVFETNREIAALNDTLRSLSLEFAKLKTAEQAEEAAKAAEPTKAPDASLETAKAPRGKRTYANGS